MNLEKGARVWAFTPPPSSTPNHPGHWEEVKIGGQFGDGGTANVYTKEPFPATKTLIKIFHIEMSAETKNSFFAKIWTITQLRNKLRDRIPVVAWPEAMVFSQQSAVPSALIGCTVPLFANARPLANLAYDLETLVTIIPNATPDTQRLVAFNIIEGFDRLHARDVLFGDPNADNILVDVDTFDVKFIDADSFGMSLIPPGGSKEVFYPPPATTAGYRSPRTALLSGPLNKMVADYGKADDNYALAIHLFSLLVPGFHPWNGMSPEAELAARQRRFPYAGPTKSLPDDCIQMQYFNALPGPIQQAFVDAFAYVNPPPPKQWRQLFKAHWGGLRGQAERLRYPPALAVARP